MISENYSLDIYSIYLQQAAPQIKSNSSVLWLLAMLPFELKNLLTKLLKLDSQGGGSHRRELLLVSSWY